MRQTGTMDGSTARDDVHRASPGPDRAARRPFDVAIRRRGTISPATASLQRDKGLSIINLVLNYDGTTFGDVPR